MERVYNFSPGPAVLPTSVLLEAQRDLLSLPGLGVSVLEVGHRTKWFEGVLETTKANLKQLLKLPDNFQIVFMQGGSRLQFSTIPMNLLAPGASADYIVTGTWGQTAAEEARREAEIRVAYDGKATNYDRAADGGRTEAQPNAALPLLHVERNNPGRAVSNGAVRWTGPFDLRRVERFSVAPARYAPLWHAVRLRTKERRPGRSDRGHPA